MNILQAIWNFISTNGWMITGGLCTLGYVIILAIMVRKIVRDSSLPEAEKPGPRPLFYLGQAYLAFVWPVPLFMALELLDVLTPSP